MDSVVVLEEDDIPGASLAGRVPSQLKMQELKFWLQCRGDSCKGLKTKAQFVKRVKEYIDSGRDKNVIDPDKDKIFTKRKQRLASIRQQSINITTTSRSSAVKYPSDGWSTKLSRLPMFTRAEIDVHISKSGKSFDGKSMTDAQHSVPTCMRKAKTFLEDEYLKDITATSDDHHFYIKCLCHHSYKKNDPPHNLKVALDIITGEVKNSKCTCVAGQVGFCNHALALMFKICKFSLYACKDTSDLDNEDDMTPKRACTSSLQIWHHKGRQEGIKPQPVMELSVRKTKLSDNHTSTKDPGIHCLLYEARSSIALQNQREVTLQQRLKELNPNMALPLIMTPSTENTEYVDTKFGKCSKGSYGSYQLQFTEANFQVFCNIDSVTRTVNEVQVSLQEFPQFPCSNMIQPVWSSDVESEQKLLDHLTISKEQINEIERKTKAQAQSEEWKEERKFRITASNFGIVMKRQRNHDTLVETLINPKTFTSRFTSHGNKYEPIALLEYQKYMFSIRQPVKILKSGFIVCFELPFLGASPDGLVIDNKCIKKCGLVEIKCPATKFLVSPLDACSDPGFFLEEVNGKPTLKKTHNYYAQVQGQLGVTQLPWCDFVVYTSAGMSIERILYDHQYWLTLKNKLKSFFFCHFLSKAATKFNRNE